ncbi:MAG: pseudouridine-5'-phosphate glycosidase [Alphaproteobacteria bacterium]|nr:pseudouridine-5'-phosphate glycosidase [Alphaproteobacteria bacterium]
MTRPYLQVSEDVRSALAEGKGVVALESTILAHGMPYPRNVETAHQVEAAVRASGSVPATIAILGGVPRIGLTSQEIERLGRGGPTIAKVSTRDLAVIVARQRDGATTVAATSRLAALAGIAVFATGGIGGVHRGAEKSFDVSADLHELAQSNVAVVTAGAKAILDLGLTLEVLESLGVPVIGYGTDEFPAFYSRMSGFAVPMRCDKPGEIAATMRAKRSLGLSGALVVANPIPREAEITHAEIAPVIAAAVAEAGRRGISGKEVTPFLLAEIGRATGGRSLAANIALVVNNARLAGEIARHYAEAAP